MRPELPDEALRAALERAIASLPPRRREVFLLRVVHDLSYKEIAHDHGDGAADRREPVESRAGSAARAARANQRADADARPS